MPMLRRRICRNLIYAYPPIAMWRWICCYQYHTRNHANAKEAEILDTIAQVEEDMQ